MFALNETVVSTGFDNAIVNVIVLVPLSSSVTATLPIETTALSSFVIVPVA